MIDPIDLVFGQHLEDCGIEGLGRGQIVPERFLDDHPPPHALRLLNKAGAAELFDNRFEKAVADGKVEQHVGLLALPAARLGQEPLQPAKRLGVLEVATQKLQPVCDPAPRFRIDRPRFAACLRRELHHIGKNSGASSWW